MLTDATVAGPRPVSQPEVEKQSDEVTSGTIAESVKVEFESKEHIGLTNGEELDLTQVQIPDSLYIHRSHGVPLVGDHGNGEDGKSGLEKTLVKRDSCHTGVPNPALHMEKRVKRLKKLNQKSYRELAEPNFIPLKKPLTDDPPETRRIQFADATGKDLFQTTYTEKLHYPIEHVEESSKVPKQPKSCCVIS